MLEVIPITDKNMDALRPLYESFREVAVAEYGWPMNAIGFSDLKQIFRLGLMHGYLFHDFAENRYMGFMFYQCESYQALEIKVIYLKPEVPVKTAMDTLFNRFIEDIQKLDNWDVVSYPVLGASQLDYTNYITWYGFKPVGQAVVKFNMFDGITLEIFNTLKFQGLPEGYRFSSWDPKYEDGAVEVLFEAFENSVDALWDPRFRSREGIREALEFVKSGGYGLFWPELDTILLNAEDQPVGVCLMNVVSPEEANIPLIGLLKSERNHKLGKTLLANSIHACINEVLKGKLGVAEISATVATENFPAIKMYRHVGFQEDHWYPHVFQNRSSVMARRPGQWC